MVARKHSRRFRSGALSAGAAIALIWTTPVPASGGSISDLDPTFGNDGQVATAFAGYGAAWDLAMVGGGRILVVGNFGSPARAGVARYLPNGNLDPAFGEGGKTSIGFAGGNFQASALVVLPSGRFVVGGTFDRSSSGTFFFALARFHQDGRLDTSFGHDGRAVAHLDGNRWYLNDLVRQTNGKLVAGGLVYGDGPNGIPASFGLARFGSDGSVDGSYGDGGHVVTSFPIRTEDPFAGPSAQVRGLTVDVAGRVVAVGSAGYFTVNDCFIDWALARYLPNGSLDRWFGGDGRVVTHVGGNVPSATAVRFGDDNRLTVVGHTRSIGCGASSPPELSEGAVARYLPNGKLDRTFSGDGKVRTRFFGTLDAEAKFEEMTLEEGGQVVAVGSAERQDSGRLVVVVAAYLRNGHLNTAFSGDGRAWAAGPLQDSTGAAVFEDPNGRPVVAGRTYSGGAQARYLVERYNASS
jgi:uncharacterized delta-60 repeat protein